MMVEFRVVRSATPPTRAGGARSIISQHPGGADAANVVEAVVVTASQHATDMNSWVTWQRTNPLDFKEVARTTNSASAATPPDVRMRIMIYPKS